MIFLTYFSIWLLNYMICINSTDISDNNSTQGCELMFSFGYFYLRYVKILDTDRTTSGDYILKFRVKARSDAHVILSPVPYSSPKQPVYEIVLGGGNNTFSDIRRAQREDTKSTVSTVDLLSSHEWRRFWINISSHGLIQVGMMGNDLPFLFWTDPEPLKINYFSFCTWQGVSGELAYGCNETKKENQTIQDLPLTTEEKLLLDLFQDYDFYMPPFYDPKFINHICIKITSWYVDLDVYSSTMTLNGYASITWFDERLNWLPEKYGNISYLNIGHFRTWRPEINVLNSMNPNLTPFNNGQTLTFSDGKVLWMPIIKFKTKCDVDLKYWPCDTHICNIFLSTRLTPHNNLTWQNIKDSDPMFQWLNSSSSAVWKIVNFTVNYSSFNFAEKNLSRVREYLNMQIRLSRLCTLYNFSLRYIFVAIYVTVLSTFWLSPINLIKIIINCLLFFLVSIFLLLAVNSLPDFSKRTPTLIMNYVLLFIVCGILNITSLFLRYLVKKLNCRSPPGICFSVMNNHFFAKYILFLRCKNSNKSDDSLKLVEDLTPTVTAGKLTNILENTGEKISEEWIYFVAAIDRLLLIVLIIVCFLVFILE